VEPLAGLRVLDVGCGGGLLSEVISAVAVDMVSAV
jgi:2-polyprenyl-3-methyl-5-hydroxy-6-metoxy-1,4-benzoquinol methylase